MGPAQMHVGQVQQAEAGDVDAAQRNVARHVVVFAAIVRHVGGIVVPQRMAAEDYGAFPPTLKTDMAPILVDVEAIGGGLNRVLLAE